MPTTHDPTEKPARPPARLRTLLLFALLILVVYADPLFSRRNFGGRDLGGYSLPIEKVTHDAWSRGRLPVWLADISGGRPLLPNPNSGVLYPVRPLLSVLPFPVAMRIFPVLHWILAGFGMILLGESLGLSSAGCWVGAVTYVLSGVSLSEVFYPNIHPGMALLPWVLWALQRPASPAGRALSLAAVFGLLFLAGDVFVCCLALLCALVWIVVEMPSDVQKERLTALACALVLAALLAAPQIVASALWIPMTNRGVLGMRLQEALIYSVSPLRLLEFVIPYPFGETWQLDAAHTWGIAVFQGKGVGFFTTFYAGSFAVIALWAVRRMKAPGARFGRILFLLAAALSVLPTFVPVSLRNLHSPLPLRYPEKVVVGMILAAAIASGVAFDAFRREGRVPRWPLAAAAALALCGVTLCVFPLAIGRLALAVVGGAPFTAARAGKELTLSLVEAGLLWTATVVALHLAQHRSRLLLTGGLALLTLVPAAATLRIARTFPEESVLAPTPFGRFLRRVDPDANFRTLGALVYGKPSVLEKATGASDPWYLDYAARDWTHYTQALWGRGTVLQLDYDHGDLSRLESLRGLSYAASKYQDSGPFFGAIALRYAIRFRDQPSQGGYRPIRNLGLQVWDEHEHAFPDVRLLERWTETSSSLDAVAVLPRLMDGEVVLETDQARAGAARPGRLRVIEKTPERLTAETETQDPSWLFVLRGFWPYRSVHVDGREVEPVPAQIAFTAVPIPQGRHLVEWEETLPGVEVSRFRPVLQATSGRPALLLGSTGGARREESLLRFKYFLLFALLILVVYADPFFSRRSFGGRDLGGYSLPIEKAIHDAWSRGRLPVWLADISGGRPLLPNPNSGVLYPVRPLLSVLSFPVAMRIFPVLHWILAGFGMILLGESLGLSAASRWMGAVTYVLSGVSVSEVFYPNIHPGMALLPWVLWTLNRRTTPPRRILSVALVFGLMILAGDIFVCALALLCALLWIVLETPAKEQKPVLGMTCVALVLAFLFAAPQVVATSLWIPMTNRAILGMKLDEVLLFSVSPWRLLEFVIPYPFGPTWDAGTNPWAVGLFRGERARASSRASTRGRLS